MKMKKKRKNSTPTSKEIDERHRGGLGFQLDASTASPQQTVSPPLVCVEPSSASLKEKKKEKVKEMRRINWNWHPHHHQ